MSTLRVYIETASGRKIGVMDVDSCVIVVQTASGRELARMRGAELSLPSVIAKYHAALVAEYGAFMSAGKILEITADEFSVHPAHVRRCVRQINNRAHTNT